MEGLTEALVHQVTQAGMSKVSQTIGADESATSAALSAAMPILMSALSRNASEPQGAQGLLAALTEDHDGSILSDIPQFLGAPESANGAGILKHILGAQQPAVVTDLAKGTGLDGDQVAQILQIAAPLVMGALGQRQRSAGLDSNGLADFLGAQQRVSRGANPADTMGVLNTLFDADKDGTSLDEAIGLAGKLLGEQ